MHFTRYIWSSSISEIYFPLPELITLFYYPARAMLGRKMLSQWHFHIQLIDFFKKNNNNAWRSSRLITSSFLFALSLTSQLLCWWQVAPQRRQLPLLVSERRNIEKALTPPLPRSTRLISAARALDSMKRKPRVVMLGGRDLGGHLAQFFPLTDETNWDPERLSGSPTITQLVTSSAGAEAQASWFLSYCFQIKPMHTYRKVYTS